MYAEKMIDCFWIGIKQGLVVGGSIFIAFFGIAIVFYIFLKFIN